MKRRDFITFLGGTTMAWPFAARAQQPAMPVVGYLSASVAGGDERLITALRQGLRKAVMSKARTSKSCFAMRKIGSIACLHWLPIWSVVALP